MDGTCKVRVDRIEKYDSPGSYNWRTTLQGPKWPTIHGYPTGNGDSELLSLMDFCYCAVQVNPDLKLSVTDLEVVERRVVPVKMSCGPVVNGKMPPPENQAFEFESSFGPHLIVIGWSEDHAQQQLEDHYGKGGWTLIRVLGRVTDTIFVPFLLRDGGPSR